MRYTNVYFLLSLLRATSSVCVSNLLGPVTAPAGLEARSVVRLIMEVSLPLSPPLRDSLIIFFDREDVGDRMFEGNMLESKGWSKMERHLL